MTKKYLISFTDRMSEMMDEIQKEKGYISRSSVIHQAVIDLHKSLFPAYAFPRKDNSPEGRMKYKKQEKEVKEKMAEEGQEKICKKLAGDIIEQASGEKICNYFTYSGKKRYPQEVSLLLLSEDMVKTQYQPNKKKVEELQKQKKVDYEI